MAAKFTMATTSGLFDAAAHVQASKRMQDAMKELTVNHERQAKRCTQHVKYQNNNKEEETTYGAAHRVKEARAMHATPLPKDTRSYVGQWLEEDELASDDEALLDELDVDPELERLRATRFEQLKQEAAAMQALRAKGHGVYREIKQDEFLNEVTGSRFVAVHFYHRDFERCRILDMHLATLALSHFECKFLKINAEHARFFVEKLAIRVLPSVVCFQDGVAFLERVVGFEGLVRNDHDDAASRCRSLDPARSSDTFPTTALARKLVQIGVLRPKHDLD